MGSTAEATVQDPIGEGCWVSVIEINSISEL